MNAPRPVYLTACAGLDGEGFRTPTRRRRWAELGGASSAAGVPPDFPWRTLGAVPPRDLGRMDELSRTLLAAVELLGIPFASWPAARRERTALVLGTAFGSLAADLDFYRTVAGPEGASPAFFARTLPSTALAEVALRHGLRGPNVCCLAGPESGRLALLEGAALVAAGESAACLVLSGETATVELSALFPALLAEAAPGAGASSWAFLLEDEDGASAARPLAVLRRELEEVAPSAAAGYAEMSGAAPEDPGLAALGERLLGPPLDRPVRLRSALFGPAGFLVRPGAAG